MVQVMVVENDDDIREIMVLMLRRGGHTVREAADGRAALDQVRAAIPDVVVSDIEMPDMSGTQLCEAIRDDPAMSDLPVVFVSAGYIPGGLQLDTSQATVVLSKPFTRRALLAGVDAALAQQRR